MTNDRTDAEEIAHQIRKRFRQYGHSDPLVQVGDDGITISYRQPAICSGKYLIAGDGSSVTENHNNGTPEDLTEVLSEIERYLSHITHGSSRQGNKRTVNIRRVNSMR